MLKTKEILIVAQEFPQRLAALRKERDLTQRILSDAAGVHVTQLRRYEAGTSQPTLDVLRKLAIALRVSADRLLFEQDERDPKDPELKYQFEAVEKLDPQEIEVIKSVLDGILLKHQAKQVTARSAG